MARRSRNSRLPGAPLRPDLTTMIDVTFLLLVFFMCTLHFTTLDQRLSAHLPKDAGASADPQIPRAPARVVLRVLVEGTRLEALGERPWSGAGTYRYGRDRVVEYQVGARGVRSLEAAAGILADLRHQEPDLALVLDPRDKIVHDEVVALLDRSAGLGFREITFAAAR